MHVHARCRTRPPEGDLRKHARRRAVKGSLRLASAEARRSKYKKLLFITFIGSVIGAVCTVPGSTYNWTDGDLTQTWSDTLNWNPNGAPGAVDTAIFNGPGGGSNVIDLGSGVFVDNIIFDTGSAAAYTLGTSTSESLTLSNGGVVTMNSSVANNEVIDATVTLGDATSQTYTFTNNSLTNTLTFAGNIAGGTGGAAGVKILDLGGAGNTTLSGVIGNGGASSLGITVSGGGTVTLNGTAVNTFSGPVTIKSGVLVVDFTHLASATDLINSNTTLNLAGGTLSVGDNANATAEQDFSHVLVSAGASAIVLNGGTGDAQMDLGTVTRTVGATVDLTATGDARIVVSSGNTVGTGANAILGGWATANGGTTWALSGGTVFSNFKTTTAGGTTASNYAGTDIDVTSSPGAFLGVITPVSIRFNTAAAETLTLATGNNVVSSGGILVTPNVGNSAELISGGTLEGAQAADLIVYVESASSTLTINSTINNNFVATGLTKGGPGTLVLTGFNSFSGNIAINGGMLETDGPDALGNSQGVITLGSQGGTNNVSLISLTGFSINNTINVASQPAGTQTVGNTVVDSYFSTINLGTASAPSNVTLNNGNTSATESTLTVGSISGTGNVILNYAGMGTGPASITLGSVNITGSITNTGNSAGGGTTTLSGLGSTVTSVTQNSSSNPLVLSGPDSFVNTAINIVMGTLSTTSASALGGTGSITLGGGSGSAALEIGVGGSIPNPLVLAVPTSGTLTIFGTSTSGAAAAFSGGITGTGNLVINSASTGGGGAVTFSGSNPINNVGSITNYGPAAVTTTLSAPLGANATHVIQNDATGVLIVGGSNVAAGYVGDYEATAGILQFSLPSQASYLTTSGKLTVTSGAALAFSYGGASDFTAAQIATVSGVSGVASGAGFGLDTTNGPATGSAIYGGFIPGTVSNFYKLGSNTLTLTNPGNAYTGSTFIAAGSLVYNPQTLSTGPITFIELNAAGGALQPGAFSTSDFSTRIANSAAAIGVDTTSTDVTIGGGLASSNTGGLNKVGLGTLFMSGSNSYSGPTTLTAGTLSLTSASVIPAASTITFNGGAIDSTTGVVLNFANAVSVTGATLGVGTALGSGGGLNFTAATAAAVSSGGTTITFNGTGEMLAFTAGWNITADSSGTFTVNGAGNNLSLGGLTLDSVVGGGSRTQTFAGSGAVTISGIVANGTSGQSLGYAGTGTMTLSGTANTYTGSTTVSSGVLSIAALGLGGSPSSIGESGNNAGFLVLAGGTLKYTGPGATTDRNFILSGNSAIDSSGSGALTMTGSPTLSGTSAVLTLTGSFGAGGTSNALSGAFSGAIGITKNGANYWTLNSATAYGYTGPTTVNQGELIVSPGAIATGQTAITINGGTLDAALSTATTGVFLAIDPFVMTGGNFIVTGKSGTAVTQTFSTGKMTFDAGFSTIKLDATTEGGTATNLTESTGSSFIRTNGATLFVDLSTAGAAGNYKTGVASTFEGWTVVENSSGVYGFGLTNTTDALLPVTTQTALAATSAGSSTDYLLTATAAGTTITNTAAAPTLRSLQFATSAGAATWNLGGKTIVIGGGALLMAPNAANGATISTGTLESGFGATPDLILHVLGAGSLTINATIADKTAGSTLTKDGTGKLILSGANTYTGATYVNQGTLQFDSATAPTGTGAITISGSGVAQLGVSSGLPANIGITFAAESMGQFQLNGNNFTAGAITSNAALPGAPVIENGATGNATLTLTGATNFAGVIKDGGAGTLALSVTSGTTILSGVNTFSGGATVSGTGILSVNNSGALGAFSFELNGGTLVNGAAMTLRTPIFAFQSTNSTINTGPGLNFTIANDLFGAGSVSAGTGTGALLLSGNNNNDFTGTFTEPATSPSALHFLMASSGSSSANWVFNGTGGVFFDPTLSGGTISFGSLNGSETIGSAPGSNGVTISAGALNGTDIYSGTISGNNAFTKAGIGTQTLSGSNTYTGQTSIQAGILKVTSFNSVNNGVPLRASSSLGDPTTVALGTIAIGAGATGAELSYTGSGETTDRVINLAGTTGGATIDQSGGGTLILTGNFTATGAGPKTLTLQGSTGAIGEIEGAVADNLAGTNPTSVTKQGTGTWIMAGPSTYTGQTVVQGGVLSVSSFNSVNSGAPPLASSSLGAPTTVALGTIGIGSGVTSGELIYTGPGETTDRVVDLAGTTGGATLDNEAAGTPLTFTSNFTASGAGSKTLTLQGFGSTGAVIAGAIVDHSIGTSTTGVTVQNGFGWTLSGANTYTGPTSISGNTLRLNAANGVGTLGDTDITVGTFGTLDVAGTPSTANGRPTSLTFNGQNNASALSLVDGSVNSFSIGGPLTVSKTAILSFELGGASGSADLLAMTGAATISATVNINLTRVPGINVVDGSYTLITAASGLGGSNFQLGAASFGFNKVSLSSSTATAEIATVTGPPPIVGNAYWTGLASANNGDSTNSWTYGASLAAPQSNWSTTANGLTDPTQAPGIANNVIFNASNTSQAGGNVATTLDANYSIKGLTFDTTNTTATVSAVNIATGSYSLGLGANGLTVAADKASGPKNNSAPTISGNGSVALNASQSWNNNSAELLTVSTNALVGTAAKGNTQTLTFAGTGSGGIALQTVIGDGANGGSLALTINQTGATPGMVEILSGNENSYSGGTTVLSGTLLVGSVDGLPNGGPVTVNGATAILNLGNDEAITGNILLSNGGRITTNGTGTLNVYSPNTITLQSGTVTANLVTNGAALNKTTSGTVLLNTNGINYFTGPITVSAGILMVGSSFALGYNAGNQASVTVNSGGTVDVNGEPIYDSLTISGSGQGGVGALENSGGSTLSGYVFGNIANNNATVNVVSANLYLSGAVTGTTLTKIGVGALIFNGTGDNAGLGLLVNNGTVYLGISTSDASVHDIEGNLTVNYTGTFGFGSALVYLYGSAPNHFSANTVVTLTNGTLDLLGQSATFDALNGSAAVSGSSAGGAIVNHGTGQSTLTVGANNGSGVFAGQIPSGSSPIALVKDGTGTQAITGSYYLAGGTTINGGTLQFASANAYSGGALTINAGTLEATQSFTAKESSFVLNSSASTVMVDSNQTYTVPTAVTGSGALTKAGAGKLVLSSTTTNFSGAVTVQSGVLAISGSLSGNINVAKGATFDVSNSGGFYVQASRSLVDNGVVNVSTNLNIDGTLSGSGSVTEGAVGGSVQAFSGTVQPGTSSSIGTLTMGALSLEDCTLAIGIAGPTSAGLTSAIATSQIDLFGNTVSLSLSLLNGYEPAAGSLFFITQGIPSSHEIGNFGNATTSDVVYNGQAYTVLNSAVAPNGELFAINYGGSFASNSFTGGGDIVLMAIPETGTWAMLLAGLGALIGLGRFSRRGPLAQKASLLN